MHGRRESASELMKVFAFIFSFIMLGLSCLPCSDGKLFAKKNTTHSVEIAKSQSDHQDTHQDLCNPFCTCACCGTTTECPKVFSIVETLPDHRTYKDNYSSSSIGSVSLPIWQPPQLFA